MTRLQACVFSSLATFALVIGALAFGLDRLLNFQHVFDPMGPPEGWRFR